MNYNYIFGFEPSLLCGGGWTAEVGGKDCKEKSQRGETVMGLERN